MSDTTETPTTQGPAFRVTFVAAQHAEAYEGVHVQMDTAGGVVHVFGPDGRTHFLTLPVGCTLIEWRDPSPLQPRPRIPPFGPGAFQQMGDELQRLSQEMERGFGRG